MARRTQRLLDVALARAATQRARTAPPTYRRRSPSADPPFVGRTVSDSVLYFHPSRILSSRPQLAGPAVTRHVTQLRMPLARPLSGRLRAQFDEEQLAAAYAG